MLYKYCTRIESKLLFRGSLYVCWCYCVSPPVVSWQCQKRWWNFKLCPLLTQLALHVLSFLEPSDILKAAQTCQTWRILCEDNLLWREKCVEAGIDELTSKQLRRRSYGGIPRSPWKSLFLRTHQIEYNWRHGSIKQPKVFDSLALILNFVFSLHFFLFVFFFYLQ